MDATQTPVAALFMGFCSRKGSACGGWLEQPQSREGSAGL